MCSIIASYSKNKLEELVDLNQFRGNFSFSYLEFENDKLNQPTKKFGPYDKNIINDNFNYKISHLQAPTGGLIQDINRIHPTTINNSKLYHNGIITPRGIKFLQNKLNSDETFDTWLLHKAIEVFGFEILSEIEGLFSCLYIKDDKIFIFRTKHGKLYIDEEMSISSERFENSKCINHDTVYELDLINKKVNIINKFKTLRCNIIVSGEFEEVEDSD